MEAYLQGYDNYKRENWARLLPMAKFAYNNKKNTNTGSTSFEYNCKFPLRASYKKHVNPRSKSKSANKVVIVLYELKSAYRKNFQHIQELQKSYHDKHFKR